MRPPAGISLVGDLPLAFVLSPDGADLIVTNNGYDKPTPTVVDTRTFQVLLTVPIDQRGWAWPGIRMAVGLDLMVVRIDQYAYVRGMVMRLRTFALPKSPTASAAVLW